MLTLLACVSAAALPQQDPAPTVTELREHVRFLASDELEGRRSGTQGADRAARYLAQALAEAGARPAGEGGGFGQAFEVALPPSPGACQLIVREWRGDEERSMTALDNVWSADSAELLELGTVACTANGSAKGELVSAGYGVVLESHGMNELKDAGVEGKIALIRRYTAFGPDADPQLAALGNLRTKIRNAAAAGAIGVILGAHPSDVEKGGEARIDFADVPGSMPIPVLTLLPDRFAALEDQFATLEAGERLEADMVANTARQDALALNVLGLIPGRSSEIVVVGAHYDHLGWGGSGSLAPGETAIHNGADDNASGTAVVLELAEALAAGPQPPRSVLFALWGAEEEGLLGSKHWVASPTVPLERVVANVNLDMVGRLQSGRVTVGSHATAAAFRPALEGWVAAGRDLQLALSEGDLPGGGGSDHMSFHGVEIPAVFFFSGLHSDYHKPSDDWDKLDYPRMSELTAMLGDLVFELGAAPREDFTFVRPRAAEGGEQRAVTGARAWFGSIPDYGAAPDGGGMQLAGVSPGGPAEKAGMQKGDVLKKVGDRVIVDIYDFMDSLGAYGPGDVVACVVLREGKTLTLPVKLSVRSQGD